MDILTTSHLCPYYIKELLAKQFRPHRNPFEMTSYEYFTFYCNVMRQDILFVSIDYTTEVMTYILQRNYFSYLIEYTYTYFRSFLTHNAI